jgi:hypothetical protein
VIKRKHDSIVGVARLVPFLLLIALPAFAADTPSAAAAKSQANRSDLIQQLETAKRADWDAALDPTVSSIRHGSFLNQMNKADRAIEELTHGFAVPQSEINDALWMPPKHITVEERAKLIEQLKQAREQDDQNEQRMLKDLAWNDQAAPADTSTFDERKTLVNGVIKDLEIGAPVHWSDIKQALVVVSSSY